MNNIYKYLLIFFLIDNISLSLSKLTGTNIGAYLKTPNPNELQYRIGTGIGGFHSTYSVDNVRSLME